MTPAKTDYELDYWKQVNRAEHDRRQQAILELWEFRAADRVLEIGTGPWGGCLPFVKAKAKIAVDPLAVTYASMFGPLATDLKWICLPVEQLRYSVIFDNDLVEFDAILSMNAIDHGNSDFGTIDIVSILLRRGGRFYLHVHLRTASQLNIGHDHALCQEELEAAIKRNRLQPIKVTYYPTDPVEGCAYRTVVGVWEKF